MPGKIVPTTDYMMPSPFRVGFSACCPRCEQGRLFDGLLKPQLSCRACNLDYSFVDSGDGPAVFVILIIGFIVTAFAMVIQVNLAPPIWLQILIWIPIIIALSLWGLRFSKGVMIALQFQTQAREGELGGVEK